MSLDERLERIVRLAAIAKDETDDRKINQLMKTICSLTTEYMTA